MLSVLAERAKLIQELIIFDVFFMGSFVVLLADEYLHYWIGWLMCPIHPALLEYIHHMK